MAGTPETKDARIATLTATQARRQKECHDRVMSALQRMEKTGLKINFESVAKEANVSVSYLYKYPELKQSVAAIRDKQLSTPRQDTERQSSVVKSQQAVITRLKARINQQEEEINRFKKINEALAGRVYRVSELEAQVERQDARIKDLEARIRELEE